MEPLRPFPKNQVETQPMFLGTDEIPITSSPIEGKPIKNVLFNNPITPGLPNWASLLSGYQQSPKNLSKKRTPLKYPRHTASETCSENHSYSSSSFKPIAEQRTRVLVTPNRKIQILSRNGEKTGVDGAQMKSFSRLNQVYQLRFDDSEDSEENIEDVKEKLKSKQISSLEDIERCENVVRKHMEEQLALKQKTEENEIMNSHMMKFIESEIGQLNLSPRSCRMLKMKQKEQDKRLVSLTLARRKTAAEIKKELMKQQASAQKQVIEIISGLEIN